MKIKKNSYPGTIKRGNTWSFYFNVDERKIWHSGFSSQKEAAEARSEALTARNRGTYVKSQNISIESYIETYWLPTLSSRVKPTTEKQYRQKTKYVIEIMGGRKIQDLRPVDVEQMKSKLLLRDSSPRTVAMAMQVLNMICQHARDVGQLIRTNPCEKVHKPRQIQGKEVRAMTPEQVRSILTSSKEGQWAGFVRLAFYTGARRGELLGLRWTDINFKASTVTFKSNIVDTDDGMTEQSTKSGRGRTLTVDAQTLTVLRTQRTDQLAKRLELGEYWQGTDDWVTVRPDGSRVTPNAATVAWKRICNKADVQGFRLHDARHTHATYLLASGVPLHVAAARLGHGDPMITAKTYAHVLDMQAIEASAVFTKAMG